MLVDLSGVVAVEADAVLSTIGGGALDDLWILGRGEHLGESLESADLVAHDRHTIRTVDSTS